MSDYVRMTRAAAKRKSSMGTEEEERVIKKRVVLGELPNVANLSQKRVFQKPGKTVSSLPKQIKPTPLVVSSEISQCLDIDARSDDPQVCAPYVADIYQYLRELEVKPKHRPLPDYLEKVQTSITPNMRGVLVDWLVEVADEYKLGVETLYLTVSHLDRFLSVETVNKNRLQLVGVSAMLIASKYEEISPPTVEDFSYITDNTFTKQDVVKMEAGILGALKFELGRPTINTFLRRFERVAQEDFKVPNLKLESLCCYLGELALLDYKAVKYVPSMLAAAAVFLARVIICPKRHPWNQALEESTTYKAADLQACVRIIHDLYLSKRGGNLQSIREKYKHREIINVT